MQQIDPAVGETIWAAVQTVWNAAQDFDGSTEMPEIRAASSDADARSVPDKDIAQHAGVDVAVVRAWLDENNDIRVVVASERETRLVEALVTPTRASTGPSLGMCPPAPVSSRDDTDPVELAECQR